MTEETNEREGSLLNKVRLEALSDCIFAFAMTLLVISLSVPDTATLVPTNAYALQVLVNLYSGFVHYALAFLILGAFWLSQHIQFHSVRAPDRIFTWINLVTLMFVALLPFSASFSGAFAGVPVGAMVFELNLLVIGLGMSLQWWYATTGNRLTDPALEPAYIRKIRFRNLVVPAVSIIGILFALAGNTWSSAIYITLPVVFYYVEHTFG
ncbi:TMEM175 family protein [uncultured Methanoregula sp.]|uniref:TMEM175 family protein n=1 Tax=uncultured Methanoregula sp. TaxID=1005933 RepID=UPI002AAA80F4|nr:TMEM175 family protein [uncultured Methanoregula sp.]